MPFKGKNVIDFIIKIIQKKNNYIEYNLYLCQIINYLSL